MSGYPAQPYSVILDQVIANGGTSGPSVDLSNYVQKWNDPTGLGTDIIVGMIELKLWDNSLGAYASLKTQEGTLQYNNDPVAMEDDSSSTLRRRGITLYDPVGDGDYFLQVTNEGLVFNGSPVAPREDLASPLGTAYVRLYDGPVGEWSQLQSIDGVLLYTNAATAEVQPVVVNVNRTNEDGIQAFRVDAEPTSMLSVSIASQGLGDGFPLTQFAFSAEGFFVTQGATQLALNNGVIRLVANQIEFDGSDYVIGNSVGFRQAISALETFNKTNIAGQQAFQVSANGDNYASLFFRSTDITNSFPQLSVNTNAEEGFQVNYGLSNFWMIGQDVILRAEGVLDLAAIGYSVENPAAFRDAISAAPSVNRSEVGVGQNVFNVQDVAGEYLTFVVRSSKDTDFSPAVLSLNAEEGFSVNKGLHQIVVRGSEVALEGHIRLSGLSYSVDDPSSFRDAILALETFAVTDIEGINALTVTPNGSAGASLDFASARIATEGFAQFNLSANSETGFNAVHGSSQLSVNHIQATILADTVSIVGQNYSVDNPSSFRDAISAAPIFDINDAEGVNRFIVNNAPAGASLSFASASLVTEGFAQLNLEVNADTGFSVGQDGASLVVRTDLVSMQVGDVYLKINAEGNLYDISHPANFRTAINAPSATDCQVTSLTVTNGTTLGVRTIATLPLASTVAGQSFRVSDSPVFANRIATSDGAVWHYEGLARQVGVNPEAGVVGAFSFKIDTQATGAKNLLFRVPYACTITGWELVANATGSVVIDIWDDSYANYPPTNADSITASAKPTLSSANKAQSSTLTGWSTSLNAGDYLEVEVESVATITNVTLTLNVVRT